MYRTSKVAAVLLLAGEGLRFNNSLAKQFHNLSGKKIYLHTLEKFQNIKYFDQIILVCHKNNINMVKKEVCDTILVIEGGETRQESSYKGLLACDKGTDIVCIHDGVRPFVSEKIILENLEMAFLKGAVDTCIKSYDTIVQTSQDFIVSIPKRDTLLRGQTPQTFKYDMILDSHEKALKKNLKNVTDDCTLVLDAGYKVHFVSGDENNIKITTQLDLFIAEQLFRLQTNRLTAAFSSLKDKIFIVVGGNGGIGSKICSELISRGAKAIPLSRHSPIKLDLTDKSSIKKAFLKIYEKYGEVDGLINSSGLLKIKPLKELSFKEIEELIEVNYSGLIFCSKTAKIKKNGHIINIASSSYSKGRKDCSIYSSCKAAVVNFTQALSEEFTDLYVNTLVPQRTNTPMRKNNFPNEDTASLLSPESVAVEVVKVLSSNLTGAIFEVKSSFQ